MFSSKCENEISVGAPMGQQLSEVSVLIFFFFFLNLVAMLTTV